MLYRAYGHTVDSDRALPELETAPPARPDFRVVWDAVITSPHDATWTTLWRFSDGEPWVTVARTSRGRHLRFGRFAEFRLGGELIEISPRGRVSDPTLRHLLLDQALPLALALKGELVLHASAVRTAAGAVLLAGMAGSGKSTMAALLGREGWPVMADDGVLLQGSGERVLAVPSYPGLRLSSEGAAIASVDESTAVPVAEYTLKRRIIPATPEGFTAAPAPVSRIYALSPGASDLTIERLSRRDAAIELVRHTYRADVEDRGNLQRQLDTIAALTGDLDVWRVTYPRDVPTAIRVASSVAAHASDAARQLEGPR
jgi:hypothetical protein